ncbi:hypothetical protein Droror1_Dr00019661 [Drosera rotundifolia]
MPRSIQSSVAVGTDSASIIIPQFYHCRKVPPPIRIMQSERRSREKLFFKCDDCRFFAWCKLNGVLAASRGGVDFVEVRNATSIGGVQFGYHCECSGIRERVKTLEEVVGLLKMVVVALSIVGTLSLLFK